MSTPDSTMTPREVVDELDRYIVGQRAAKRAVAIALRNRHRRKRVEGDLREVVTSLDRALSERRG